MVSLQFPPENLALLFIFLYFNKPQCNNLRQKNAFQILSTFNTFGKSMDNILHGKIIIQYYSLSITIVGKEFSYACYNSSLLQLCRKLVQSMTTFKFWRQLLQGIFPIFLIYVQVDFFIRILFLFLIYEPLHSHYFLRE